MRSSLFVRGQAAQCVRAHLAPSIVASVFTSQIVSSPCAVATETLTTAALSKSTVTATLPSREATVYVSDESRASAMPHKNASATAASAPRILPSMCSGCSTTNAQNRTEFFLGVAPTPTDCRQTADSLHRVPKYLLLAVLLWNGHESREFPSNTTHLHSRTHPGPGQPL